MKLFSKFGLTLLAVLVLGTAGQARHHSSFGGGSFGSFGGGRSSGSFGSFGSHSSGGSFGSFFHSSGSSSSADSGGSGSFGGSGSYRSGSSGLSPSSGGGSFGSFGSSRSSGSYSTQPTGRVYSSSGGYGSSYGSNYGSYSSGSYRSSPYYNLTPSRTNVFVFGGHPYTRYYYGGWGDYSYGWSDPYIPFYYHTPFYPTYYYNPPIIDPYTGVAVPGGLSIVHVFLGLIEILVLIAVVVWIARMLSGSGRTTYRSY